MKNTINIFATLFALIVVASCTKEVLTSNEIKEDATLVPYTVNVSIAGTKATISGLEVLWQDGDKIAIFDGVAKREFTLSSGAGTKTATFTGEIASTATTISAVAPYSAAGEEAGQYNVPEEQNIAAGATVDPAAVIMVAAEVAKNEALSFTNPCGVARMTVPAGADSVSVSCTAGLYKVKFPAALSAAGNYDLVLPAGEQKDIKVVTTIAGVDYFKTTENTLEITAGSIIKLGDIKGEPGIVYAGEFYKIVKLKDGNWWMAENLRFVPKGITPSDDKNNVTAGVYYPLVINSTKSAAEFSKEAVVIKSNGYLYQSEVALGLKVGDITTEAQAKALEGCQGICPAGWHIPTITDITGLVGKAVSPITTVTTAPYYNGSDGSISMLNTDGFNIEAYGAVSISNVTTTTATFTGWLSKYPDKISSGYICGSSFASYVTDATTGGIKNVQFYGFMPMTNKTDATAYTLNGAKMSYRNGAAVRCVKDKK